VSDIQEEIKFPIREAREMVKDLMLPNAFIYWVDFLFHIIKKFSHLNEVEIDVFDIDKRILNLLKFTISKLNIPMI